MKVIMQASDNIIKILGAPKVSSEDYRPMNYVLTEQTDDGMLMFNTLTRELILLDEDEYNCAPTLPELRKKWFYVPKELCDKEYADRVKFVLKATQKDPEHITNYTIFTTTDCNARCFYCYEMGRSRIPMSEDVAHKSAKYIADHCGGKIVKLRFFGGEPLFNKDVIDIITTDLKTYGVEYISSMVSNAYLFDEEAIEKAKTLWNLKKVQVTLDGTEETYNKTKAFIYRDGKSPYQIVLNNIEKLLNAQIKVVVRMNIDKHNADDLMLLADQLHKRFSNKKSFDLYSHMLFEFSGAKEHIRTNEERKSLYQKQKNLTRKLRKYGYGNFSTLSNKPKLNMCMADSKNAITILPNGEIGLCEHFSEDNFVGNINENNLDTEKVNELTKVKKPIDDCEKCAYYPMCVRLEKCPEAKECFAQMQEEYKQKLLGSMEKTYKEYKKGVL